MNMNTTTIDEGLNIRDMVKGKPSVAVRAMVAGLHNTERSLGKVVDMSTYGKVERRWWWPLSKVCYGCAATWAVRELVPGLEVNDNNRNAGRDWGERTTVREFESCIDSLRGGAPMPLMLFCGLSNAEAVELTDGYRCSARGCPLPNLGTDNWKERLPHYEAFAAELEAKGY